MIANISKYFLLTVSFLGVLGTSACGPSRKQISDAADVVAMRAQSVQLDPRILGQVKTAATLVKSLCLSYWRKDECKGAYQMAFPWFDTFGLTGGQTIEELAEQKNQTAG